MLPVRLLLEARGEFDHAADWYERQRIGLGAEFVVEVRETLNRITADPKLHPPVYGDVRRVLVKKFPYVVLFRVEPAEVLVIAIVHTARDASVWKSRM